ncbi:MAG TPA: ABC transporter substrate-binding protein [Candidatus Binatia bacterium]|nr:ABC transporter substrate-binding protein [Candidatus Binatia bacterium]
MKKLFVGIALCAMLSAFSSPAEAQPSKKLPRIGFLASGSPSSDAAWIEAFRQGLHQLGYVERQNIVIEYRYGEGKTDRFVNLASELDQLNVDVIVVSGATATRAAKNVTKLRPIVMANVTDPVVLGLVASVARPGGNITGLTNLAPELGGKRLELLKEIVPKLSRVAVLGDPTSPGHTAGWRETEIAAQSLGVQVQSLEVRAPNPDFEGAFSAITRHRANALLTLSQPLIRVYRQQIVDFTAKRRVPAIFPFRELVEAGGLMSYGANVDDMFRRAATYVDKILKGTKPADLPVEQPTKFELLINLKAAQKIGLTIPPEVLARADRVIK